MLRVTPALSIGLKLKLNTQTNREISLHNRNDNNLLKRFGKSHSIFETWEHLMAYLPRKSNGGEYKLKNLSLQYQSIRGLGINQSWHVITNSVQNRTSK